MQEEDDSVIEKQPIEMTSDELLDYAIAPEVAERLKARILEQEDCDPDPD